MGNNKGQLTKWPGIFKESGKRKLREEDESLIGQTEGYQPSIRFLISDKDVKLKFIKEIKRKMSRATIKNLTDSIVVCFDDVNDFKKFSKIYGLNLALKEA